MSKVRTLLEAGALALMLAASGADCQEDEYCAVQQIADTGSFDRSAR